MRLPELPGYKIEKPLGEDPFGWSFLARFEDRETRVVRILKSLATNDMLVYQALKPFASSEFEMPGMARVFDYAFQDRDTLTAYAMPFFGWESKESGEIHVTSFKHLSGLNLIDQDQAMNLIEILGGRLAAIHDEGFFHGGLRPSNVFVIGDADDRQDVCIGQFGEAFVASSQYLEAGELMFYLSPEQLSTGDHSAGQGREWDIYSFGVVAYQLLTGRLPRLHGLYEQYLEDPDPFNHLPAISFGKLTVASGHFAKQLAKESQIYWPEDPSCLREKLLRPIVEKCLAHDQADRYQSMGEVVQAFADTATDLELLESQEKAVHEEISAPKEEKSSLIPFSVSGAFRKRKARAKKTRKTKASAPAATVASDSAPEELLDTSASSQSSVSDLAPARSGSAFSSLAKLGSSTPFYWRVAGIAALLAFFPLVGSTLFYKVKLGQERNKFSSKDQLYQTNLEKQAASFAKMVNQSEQSEDELRSELDEAEDLKSRLIGEATLARQLVRYSQENGDLFFRLVLDNRDTDVPSFHKDRAIALEEGRKHYERLIEAYGEAEDFLEATADALYYLGEIYKESGDEDLAASVFAEAEQRYLAIRSEQGKSKPVHLDNLARAKRSMGEISMKHGNYTSALQFFGESSSYLGEFRRTSPADSVEASIRIQENLIEIAECERVLNREEVALDAARSIASQLIQLQETEVDNDQVIGALAKAFALSARILEGRGEVEKSVEAYQQTSNLFAQAVKLNAAVDSYHLGLGNSLARVGLLKNDAKKLEAAAEVLARVIPENPYEPNYQKTLADVFGALAKNQRDGGQRSNAIALETRAVELLRPVLSKNASAPADVKFSYGERLAHLAELLGDSGDYDESRKPLQEAISIFSSIANGEYSRPRYRSALAKAQGLAGFACLKKGDKAAAKNHYEMAQAEWQTYMRLNPDDNDALRAAKWTEDQLAGL